MALKHIHLSTTICLFALAALPLQAQTESTVWRLDNLESLGGQPLAVEGSPRLIDTPRGKAIEFDGVDDALFLDVHPLEGWSSFTVEVVFNPYSDGPTEQRFFHMQENETDSRVMFETRIVDGNRWFLDTFIKSGEQKVVNYAQNHLHPTGAWYHAAIVVDGQTFKHYVDGELELSEQLDYAAQREGHMSLGVRINRVNWFKGAIRTIRFTPQALAPNSFLSAKD
ncbi:LamG-like jellyroll fold domain-containing protein [Pelagicoccus sp. SDUM812005]|uniref:LamG-like jellyroll fold domain-containing protein n=1 Tax=Pelagicoccus sp. SDUM812005 TaxID=3041257 RepID=UPI00280D951D|nr:LamG-like jellyroll fold domain-containing protein [Pelagicoccus sp. SDUM812005]MDQ8180716.1 hypothetical protein [Pelagicoccus sp. SDUM812005]